MAKPKFLDYTDDGLDKFWKKIGPVRTYLQKHLINEMLLAMRIMTPGLNEDEKLEVMGKVCADIMKAVKHRYKHQADQQFNGPGAKA